MRGKSRLPVPSSELMGCSHSKRNRCEWEIFERCSCEHSRDDALWELRS
jgi:hypothetical protein